MGTKRITDLTVAGTVDGTEEVPVWQGASRKVTIQQILDDLGIDTSALVPGTADGVTAMGLLIPVGDDVDGILIKGGSNTWGDIGVTAGGGDPDYGKGQVFAYHRYDPTSEDPNDVLLFRLDKTGGLGLAGGVHNAFGFRQADDWVAGTQAEWIQLFVNTNGLVINPPDVSDSATWDKNYIVCYDGRRGRTAFAVGTNGNIEAPNARSSPTRYRLFDDFETADTQGTTLGQIGGSAGFAVLSGTGAQVSQVGLNDSTGKGIAANSSGTTTTGFCATCFLHEVFLFTAASTELVFGARVKMPALSDGTDTFSVRVGLVNGFTNTLATDGLTFRLPNGSNWLAVNRRAGTETAVDTGVAGSANTWVNLCIRYDPTNGARYYINGALVATITANKPTDTTGLFALAGIVKSAGTNARFAYVDAMNLDAANDRDLEQILA